MSQITFAQCPQFKKYRLDMTPPFIGSFTPTKAAPPYGPDKPILPTMKSAVACHRTGELKCVPSRTVAVATEEGYVKLPQHSKEHVQELSYSPTIATLQRATHGSGVDTSLLNHPLRFY